MEQIVKYGFTFYLTIGKWATPKIQYHKTTRAIRICFGFGAIKIGLYDLESWERKVLTAYIETDDKLKALRAS